MPDISFFPITQRWPAAHPDHLQLDAAPTPHGVEISISLEETGLAHEPHLIDISKNGSSDPACVPLNPNGRIPAITDPAGRDGRPIALLGSGAILLYLADKTGEFIPTAPAQRYETLAWLFFQVSAIGPTFGQLGFFPRFAGRDYKDKRPRPHFTDQSRRFEILDRQLQRRDWIVDDYSIADIATLSWVKALVAFFTVGDILGLSNYSKIQAWLGHGVARAAVQRGLHIPARPA
jgi:GST-like protein